jgi:hypothetical protein
MNRPPSRVTIEERAKESGYGPFLEDMALLGNHLIDLLIIDE